MKRGKKNRKNNPPRKNCLKKKHSPKTVMPFGYFAVIPSNTVAVKRKFLRQLSQTRKDVEKCQREWNKYNEKEKPAFTQWLHQAFGRELSDLRDTQQKLTALNGMIDEIEERSFFSGKSPRKYYQEAQSLREEKGPSLEEALHQLEPEFPDDEFDSDDEVDFSNDDFDDEDDDFDEDSDDELEDDLNEFFENIGKMFGFDAGKFISGRSKKRDMQTDSDRQGKLKDIYRKLCFQLHPDTGREFNSETKALWHEAQDAYMNGDLERLESIQCRLDLDCNPLASHVSCSQILDEIRFFQDGMQAVSSLVREARKDISWGSLSWNRQKEKQARRILQSEMSSEMNMLKYELSHSEKILEKWSKPLKSKTKNKNQASGRNADLLQMTFSF